MYLHVFICFTLYITCLQSQLSLCRNMAAKNLTMYLSKRSEFVNHELRSILGDNNRPAEDSSRIIEFDKAKLVPLRKKCTSAHMFSLFNMSTVLTDTDLYLLSCSINDDACKLDDPYYKLERSLESAVSFVRVTETDEVAIVLTAFSNHVLNIYQVTKDTTPRFLFIQSIFTAAVSDAHFFKHKGKLYLVVINNRGVALTQSVIYKWTGTYFDTAEEILTQGATSVTSFTKDEDEIIIITQNLYNTQQVYSLVYQFEGHRLRRIQLMSTENPRYSLTYEFQKMNYVIIVQECSSKLYVWNGLALTDLNVQFTYPSTDKVFVGYVESFPVIFFVQQETISIYTPTRNSLRVISLSEKKIIQNFTEILNLEVINSQNKNMLRVLVNTNGQHDTPPSVAIVPFSFRAAADAEIHSKNMDTLLECMKSLNTYVEFPSNNVRSSKRPIDKLVKSKELLSNNTRITAPSFSSSAKFKSNASAAIYYEELSKLEQLANQQQQYAKVLKSRLQKLVSDENTRVVNGKVFLQGTLNGTTLSALDLHIKQLNNLQWLPNQWLSRSKLQVIPGRVITKSVTANDLQLISPNRSVLNDFALIHGNQFLSGTYKIQDLEGHGIFCNNIDKIPINSLYMTSRPHIGVKGLKIFERLSAPIVNTDHLNQNETYDTIKIFGDPLSFHFKFDSHLIVNNLHFNEMNGVRWDRLKDSVFRYGATTQITGDLQLKEFNTYYLYSNNIANNSVVAALTSTTDQIIYATVHFANVDALNVKCDTINGINITKEAAISNELNEETIRGPVNAMKVGIRGNLHLLPSENRSADHIQGTTISDLLQVYNKKVIIRGNLRLTNILFSNKARLSINEREIADDIVDTFWLAHQRQIISVHPLLHGANISHVDTKRINDVYIENYMTDTPANQFPTNIYFENITISGNVLLNRNVTNFPNVHEINANTVKYNGKCIIKGNKNFLGEIKIKNADADFVNNVHTYNTLVRSRTMEVAGNKTFKNVVVRSNFSSEDVHIKLINNINLHELKNSALYIDKPANITAFNLDKLSVGRLFASKMNGVFLSEYVLKLDNERVTRTLRFLRVDGNLTIRRVSELSTINEVDIKSSLQQMSNDVLVIDKHIKFPGQVHTHGIDVRIINNISIMNLTPRLLYKQYNQNISGHHVFNAIRTHRLYTPRINNVILNGLINIKEKQLQYLMINGGLDLRKVRFSRSLIANKLICSLNKVIFSLHHPEIRQWEMMHILKHSVIMDSHSKMRRILQDSFTKKTENITEPVIFEGHIFANTVYSDYSINDINVAEIFLDVLLKDSSEKQTISGKKVILSMKTEDAVVFRNADIPFINDIDISKLNASLVSRNEEKRYFLSGVKILGAGLKTSRFYCKTISEIDSDQLVSTLNRKPILNAVFNQLVIGKNLSLHQVNRFNFVHITHKRVMRHGNAKQSIKGRYNFKEIYLEGDSITSRINDIPVEEVVVDGAVQTVSGNKAILKNIYIGGSVSANHINGYTIEDLYQNTIFLKKNATIISNVGVSQSNILGNIETNRINGVYLSNIKDAMRSKISETLNGEVLLTIQEIVSLIESRLPDRYMYIDRSQDLQISLSNAVNAYVVNTGVDVLIHVDSEVSGNHCGLLQECICNVQHTIHVTSQKSANQFVTNVNQRVFSYNGEGITAHLFTNSISMNSHCRTNSSKVSNEEYFLLSWTSEADHHNHNLSDGGGSYTQAFNISGYISDVAYFAIENHVYVVICRFYDPVLDTHDLDCIVIRISRLTNEAAPIQQIATSGARTLYVFHTAQGVTLIIGNILGEDGDQRDHTQIYRFHAQEEKFFLLRTIRSVRCSSATGIVLGDNSLIMLVQQEAPIQVLKYDHRFDNYYFYQSFQLDTSLRSVSSFYVGGFGIGDAYMCAVTRDGNFYVYSFCDLEGWKMEATGVLIGLQNLVPFELNEKLYLFAPSSKISSLLTVMKHSNVHEP